MKYDVTSDSHTLNAHASCPTHSVEYSTNMIPSFSETNLFHNKYYYYYSLNIYIVM